MVSVADWIRVLRIFMNLNYPYFKKSCEMFVAYFILSKQGICCFFPCFSFSKSYSYCSGYKRCLLHLFKLSSSLLVPLATADEGRRILWHLKDLHNHSERGRVLMTNDITL